MLYSYICISIIHRPNHNMYLMFCQKHLNNIYTTLNKLILLNNVMNAVNIYFGNIIKILAQTFLHRPIYKKNIQYLCNLIYIFARSSILLYSYLCICWEELKKSIRVNPSLQAYTNYWMGSGTSRL